MENQNKHHVSNFWFGFLLGTATAGAGAFLLGTKNGRKTLQKLLDLTENLEENIAFIFEEMGDELKEKGAEIQDALIKPAPKKESSSIGQLLTKIKTLSPESQSKIKKFFVKE